MYSNFYLHIHKLKFFYFQLQTLLSEELCSKLLALYSFGNGRIINKSVYYSDCVELLAEGERCYQFELSKENTHRVLFISVLDSAKDPPQFIDISLEKHEKWSQYVDSYMGSESEDLNPQKQHLFLLRFVFSYSLFF